MILGRIVSLHRYPVKSMAPEALEAAELHWTGLAGDRQYAFVRAADRGSFPWLTGRQVPALVLHRAEYAGSDPRGAVEVTRPDGRACAIGDPALADELAAAAGEQVRLMRLSRGAYDAMPVSVLTTTDAAAVEQAHGSALGTARYRSNVVIEPARDAPAGWDGLVLRLGEGGAQVRADWGIPRCAMITLDPDTAARDPSVLRTVAQRFANEVGTYCAVVSPGPIRVGDVVRAG